MFEEIVGSSPALKTVLSSHRESGSHKLYGADYGRNRTGKELIARAIHKGSQRAPRLLSA